MALIAIRHPDGRSELVHSSVFGAFRSLMPDPTPWPDIWRKFDEAKPALLTKGEPS